jgi:hypothetical protein
MTKDAVAVQQGDGTILATYRYLRMILLGGHGERSHERAFVLDDDGVSRREKAPHRRVEAVWAG